MNYWARVFATVVFAVVAGRSTAFAQRGAAVAAAPAGRNAPPTGAEIAAAARAATLDAANAGRAMLYGQRFVFTPARVSGSSAAESGAYLGVLENGAAGDETGLPPGKYNIFVAKVNTVWKAYAESDGRIVREAIRASASSANAGGRPRFAETGWCNSVIRMPYEFTICF